MEQNEKWREIAGALNKSYTRGRLLETGLPEDVTGKIGGHLYALTQYQGMWPTWCRKILEDLGSHRELKGLEELVAFATKQVGGVVTGTTKAARQRPAEAAAPVPVVITPAAQAPGPESRPQDATAVPADATPEPESGPMVTATDQATAVASEPEAPVADETATSVGTQDDHDQTNEAVATSPAGMTVAAEAEPAAVAEQGRPAGKRSDDAVPADQDHYVCTLPIDGIEVDPTIQPRATLNPEVVAEYAEAYRRGDKLPPVTVFFCDFETHLLADGFHRFRAAKQAGLTEIEVDLHAGGRREAILYAVSANTTHGLRRTNADKRRAVETLLKDDEWKQWPDREIARRVGVGHDLVAAVRAELSGGKRQISTTRRVKRGGSEYLMKLGTRNVDGATEINGDSDDQTNLGSTIAPERDSAGTAGGTVNGDVAAVTGAEPTQVAADAAPEALVARDDDATDASTMFTAGKQVYATIYRVLANWVSLEKVDRTTASRLLNEVNLELERLSPGFYHQAVAFALERKRETNAAKEAA
jgi:hypothetical protein